MSIFIAEYTGCSDYQNHVYVQYGNYHGFVLKKDTKECVGNCVYPNTQLFGKERLALIELPKSEEERTYCYRKVEKFLLREHDVLEESFKEGDKVVISNYNSKYISVGFGDTVLVLNRHNLKTDAGQELPRKYFSTVLKFLESRRW